MSKVQTATFPAARTLATEQQQLLEAGLQEICQDVKARWTGWKDSTGRSQRGWKVVKSGKGWSLVNDVPYAASVHRAGSKTPELKVVQEQIIVPKSKKLAQELLKALVKAVTPTIV